VIVNEELAAADAGAALALDPYGPALYGVLEIGVMRCSRHFSPRSRRRAHAPRGSTAGGPDRSRR